jgi:hypothetical protein
MSAALGGESIEFGDEVLASNRPLHQTAEAFAGVFVDDGHDLDRTPVGGGVEFEVSGPHPVGRVGGRTVGHGRHAVAFAAPPLRHPQPFLTPKPLDLLVIDVPALTTGIVISGPQSAARMIASVIA